MKPELVELLATLSEVIKHIHLRSYHTLNDMQIYPGQPKLIMLIKENEGITQKELAEKNFVTPATITGMLGKLEAKKYVYRVPDEVDKRIMRVYLTPEGTEFAKHAKIFISSMISQIFDGVTDDELNTLLTITQKLKSNIRNCECNK